MNLADLVVFKSDEFGEVRTLDIDGKPYFVGKDVAEILGYKNPNDAFSKHVDAEDKKTIVIRDGIQGNPNQVVINESGLYSLILSSKLPKAKEFKRWVTSVVLPSIREHGVYASRDFVAKAIADPKWAVDALARAFMALDTERERNAQLTEQVAELEPKGLYYDLVLMSPKLMPITLIAKDYGMSGVELNKLLHEWHIQYKIGKRPRWVLYQEHAGKGWTGNKTELYKLQDKKIPVTYMQWTHKGRLAIYELMKAHDILPIIEREDLDTVKPDSEGRP